MPRRLLLEAEIKAIASTQWGPWERPRSAWTSRGCRWNPRSTIIGCCVIVCWFSGYASSITLVNCRIVGHWASTHNCSVVWCLAYCSSSAVVRRVYRIVPAPTKERSRRSVMQFFTGTGTAIGNRNILGRHVVTRIVVSICSVLKRILSSLLMVRMRNGSISSSRRSLCCWLVRRRWLSNVGLLDNLSLAHRPPPRAHVIIFNRSGCPLSQFVPLAAPATEQNRGDYEG